MQYNAILGSRASVAYLELSVRTETGCSVDGFAWEYRFSSHKNLLVGTRTAIGQFKQKDVTVTTSSPSPHPHGCIVEIFSLLNCKVVMASLLKIPSYLKRVATLPCEILGIWPGFLCHPPYELLEALEMASSQIYSAAPERVPPACGRT